MNAHYTYFLILAGSLAGPLALSFDKKVAFCSKWKFLFPAMIFPAVFYIVWDIIFTAHGVWSFNDDYVVGIRIAGLPIEEILFFLLIPFCCVFIYECVRCYFPQLGVKTKADIILKTLAFVLLVVAIVFRDRAYTFWTFLFTAIFIFLLYALKNFFRNFNAVCFLVSYGVSLLPFLIVNGLLTRIPVVIYNNAENLRLRIDTIPFEDVFYGMLLILMVVSLYERKRTRKT